MSLVSLIHERWRRRVSLHALGALDDPAERAATEGHLRACAACRAEIAALHATLEQLPEEAAPAAALPHLVAGVERRIEERLASGARRRALFIAVPVAAAAALVALAVVPLLLRRASSPPAAPTVETASMSSESLDRLENTLAREHAARYLSEAQDLLVNVAAGLPHCTRQDGRVDVAEEARRSRSLLERRALLVQDTEAIASARPVIDDVDDVLREVAALDECARRQDLRAIHGELERRQILMKIELMARELAG